MSAISSLANTCYRPIVVFLPLQSNACNAAGAGSYKCLGVNAAIHDATDLRPIMLGISANNEVLISWLEKNISFLWE